MNDFVDQVTSSMVLREPTVWRWSHVRHHTDTTVVGRDPAIGVPRPPSLANLLLNVFAIRSRPLSAPARVTPRTYPARVDGAAVLIDLG